MSEAYLLRGIEVYTKYALLAAKFDCKEAAQLFV